MTRATPAQDRLLSLLRRAPGPVRRAEALRVASASTVARAVRAGRVERIVRGRSVWLMAARAARPLRLPARRPAAARGVPGGRLDAMARLLAGRVRTPAERAVDALTGRGGGAWTS